MFVSYFVVENRSFVCFFVVCFNRIKCAFERGKYLMLPSCQNSARFLPKMKSEAHVKPCAVSPGSQCS